MKVGLDTAKWTPVLVLALLAILLPVASQTIELTGQIPGAV